jgi:uncharacterized protein (TIGR02680 family)
LIATADTGTDRWVPWRAGIANVWRYHDEVFAFHRGRLLLRGPNGSGKSKALELLLPFLFDANLRANRLSTFGTGDRTMHWNLMGEGSSGKTRIGFVWLEFRRLDPEAGERWFTCGARLSATSNTTNVDPSYFTTAARIGAPDGLALLDDARHPVTRAALEDALTGTGQVYPSASEYRAALRSTLFDGVAEARYDALITALLQLRTPKLSQRLDPALLSDLLSRALPTLAQSQVSELAEGFERLDRQREQLAALDREVSAARLIADRQNRYARRVLRAAAAGVISRTTKLDDVTKQARASAAALEQANAQATAVATDREVAETTATTAQARIEGLQESDNYRAGAQLDELRRRAEHLGADAGRAHDRHTKATRTATLEQERATEAALQRDRVAQLTQTAEQHLVVATARAGLAFAIDSGEVDTAHPSSTRSLVRATVEARRTQLEEVRTALHAHERAITRRSDAEGDLDEARSALARCTDALTDTRAQLAEADSDQRARLAGWASTCRELRIDDVPGLLECTTDEAAVAAFVEPLIRSAREYLTLHQERLDVRRDGVDGERQAAQDELSELRNAREIPPPPPRTRTVNRAGAPGAPFWQLVDFAADVTAERAAGVEAALEASGLLDAWVGPNGIPVLKGHDTFAEPGLLPPVGGPTLSAVLVPDPHAPVPTARITALLARIAFGERLPPTHPAAIAADGSWRLGTATGSWAKASAGHIGAEARARSRATRMAEIEAGLAELDRQRAAIEAESAELAARRARLDAETAARPDHRLQRDAAVAVDRAEAQEAAADTRVGEAGARLRERERTVDAAFRALAAVAARHRLPTEEAALDELSHALQGFADAASAWLERRQDLGHATASATEAQGRAVEAEAAKHGAAIEARQADEAATTHAARVAAIEDTVGVEYREVLDAIAKARAERDAATQTAKRLESEQLELQRRIGVLENKTNADGAARESAAADRDVAGDRFRRLGSTSFPSDAGIDLDLRDDDRVRATLDAARAIAARWPGESYDPSSVSKAYSSLSDAVHQGRESLADRVDLVDEADEDVHVLRAVVHGVGMGAGDLHRLIQRDAERAREDITAAERDLFDRTLTGDTRRHLADRIRAAGDLVDSMNARLERVRTASDVRVRLVWQVKPELPSGTKHARDLLLVDPARLSEADRNALHEFFRERIDAARVADTSTGWEQQLAEVFDYTRWHQFLVKVDRGKGDGWQAMTSRLHGALSGGEKAIALHLPLFAAVAAHYQSLPNAPRLILLDEVFVGVDVTNRGQVFDLLASLDLDLVLTSDHEWCTYAELDGIAIHQLMTGADDDAVTTARFVWDGRRTEPADLTLLPT